MALDQDHRNVLQSILEEFYPTTAGLDFVLRRDLGINLGDLTAPVPRPDMYRAAIARLDDDRKIPALIKTVVDDRKGNTLHWAKLADILKVVWPEGEEFQPHQHLLVSNVAFVNRNSIRDMVFSVASKGTPRVMLIRGRGLAGSSHCGNLIQHVAQEKGGIEVFWLDLDMFGERTPSEIMNAFALQADIDPPPPRNDLLAADGAPDTYSPQLTSFLCNWFLGKARALRNGSNKALWLLIDNAHRDIVPAPAREMVTSLVRLVDAGSVPGLRLFVLGFDGAMPTLFNVGQLEVSPLGQPDITAYLGQVLQRYKSLDGFPTVAAAATAILAACNLANPNAEEMRSMTKGLSELVRRVR